MEINNRSRTFSIYNSRNFNSFMESATHDLALDIYNSRNFNSFMERSVGSDQNSNLQQ